MILRLSEVATFLSGGTPAKANQAYWSGSIPWVSAKDLVENRIYDAPLKVTEEAVKAGSRLVPANTVLFVVRGMSLAKEFRVGIAKTPVAFNQDLKALRCRDGIVAEYVFWALFAQRESIKMLAGEASHGTKKLPTDVISDIRLRIPDTGTQLRIAEVANAYEDLIENNRRRIALLEQTARLLYREWFVHLRFPGHEHVQITEGVPLGWQQRALRELATIHRGRSYTSDELADDGGRPFVNLKCFERLGGFRVSGIKNLAAECKPKHLVCTGDIVLAVTDVTRDAQLVAQAARIPAVVPEAAFSMDLVKIVPRDEVEPEWLYGALRYSSFSMELREKASGATVLHLKPSHVEDQVTLVPTRELRGQYADVARHLTVLADNLQLQSERARQARDLLLPRLMSGQIRV